MPRISGGTGGSGPAPSIVKFTVAGAVTVAAGTERVRFPSAATIVAVSTSINTAPTGATLIVDVNKNGTTVFTTQANRPTIAISGNASSNATPDVTTIAAGDYLSVDVDQVGSTIAGSNLVVEVLVLIATAGGSVPTTNAGGVLSGTYPSPDFAVDMATQAELDAVSTVASGAIPKSLVDAAGDLLVGSADNTVARLAKGTDGQVLKMASGAVAWGTDLNTGGGGGGTLPTDNTDGQILGSVGTTATWLDVDTAVSASDIPYSASGTIAATDVGAAIAEAASDATQKATLTTKGDLYVATGAGTVVRVGVGSNNDVLTADSAQTAGLKWAAGGGGGGAAGVHPAMALGLKTWNHDPLLCDDSVIQNGGVLIVGAIVVPYDDTYTGIAALAKTAGSGLTVAYGALWDVTGATRVAKTASQTATWNSTGYKKAAFSGAPVSLTAGVYLFGLLTNGTTATEWRAKAGLDGTLVNADRSDPAYRAAYMFPADDTTTVLTGLNSSQIKTAWVGLY
jgi:hypothetical protein